MISISRNLKPLIGAGLALGVGLGGFFDGILFHQILQLHGMVSHEIPRTSVTNMEVNMFWDGLFHALTWTMSVLGVGLLWRAVQNFEVTRYTKTLVGSMLGGWGLFNFVEGVIDHHLLEVHHVVDGATHIGWDLLFLASGIILIVAGYTLVRKDNAIVHIRTLKPVKAA